MKMFAVVALAVATAFIPALASAKDEHHRPRHAQQQYPKGWGPHRAADGKGYYHGYRGSRDHRAGYRRGNDGLWYPAAAFAVGALIGGAFNRN